MEPHCSTGRVQGPQALSKERNQHPRQNIAAAANCHSGIAGGIDKTVRSVGDHSTVAFQHAQTAQLPGKLNCGIFPAEIGSAAKTAKLSGMGRQDHRTGTSPQDIYMPGQYIYAVGIHHNGNTAVFKHSTNTGKNAFRLAKTRADKYRIHMLQTRQQLPDRPFRKHTVICRKRKHHRLIELDGSNGIHRFRHPQIYESAAAAAGSHSGKGRRACIADAAAQQQNTAKIPLVGIRLSVGQHGPYHGLCNFTRSRHGITAVLFSDYNA